MRSTPPSTLNGLVRDEPRMVPPRGRMPRTAATSSGHRQALERALPAVAEADELVAVLLHALAHDGPDHRVETGAVAAAGQHSDAHLLHSRCCAWVPGRDDTIGRADAPGAAGGRARR